MQRRLRLPALMLAAAVLAIPAHSGNHPNRSTKAAHKAAPKPKLPAGVDWSFIAANEGTTLYGTVLLRAVYSAEPIAARGQLAFYSRNQGRLIGYHVIGKSGVTIGTGVDLGQHDLAHLPVSAGLRKRLIQARNSIQIPDDLISPAEAYRLQAQAAALKLSPAELTQLDSFILTQAYNFARNAWNSAAPTRGYARLTGPERTVVVDWVHQYGAHGVTRLNAFSALVKGNVKAAISYEQARGDYPYRNSQRAARLAQGLHILALAHKRLPARIAKRKPTPVTLAQQKPEMKVAVPPVFPPDTLEPVIGTGGAIYQDMTPELLAWRDSIRKGVRLRLVPSVDSSGLERWVVEPHAPVAINGPVYGILVAGTPFIVRKDGDRIEVQVQIGGVRRMDGEVQSLEFTVDQDSDLSDSEAAPTSPFTSESVIASDKKAASN